MNVVPRPRNGISLCSGGGEMTTNMFGPDLLSQVLILERSTGNLFWLPRDMRVFSSVAHGRMWNTRFAGKPALASVRPDGYLEGFVHRRKVLAHRVVFCMASGEWPVGPIDHINGIRSDNRPENLRMVTVAENNRNRAISKNSQSGVMGVFWNAEKQAFDAEITKNGVKTRLGRFEKFNDAVKARRDAERMLGFGNTHGRR